MIERNTMNRQLLDDQFAKLSAVLFSSAEPGLVAGCVPVRDESLTNPAGRSSS
jgi:hypothetical protein